MPQRVELPPNGQGLVALVLLNILENFDLASFDPNGPEGLHIALEAARLEGVDGYLARQRMRGRRHAVAGKDRRAAGAMEVALHCGPINLIDGMRATAAGYTSVFGFRT